MNIEIVNFYETQRNDDREVLQGTMHIRLVDLGIDLRGIFVSKNKERWSFSMPFRKAKDQTTGEDVRYAVFAFNDLNKQQALEHLVKEKGKAYIIKRMSS